VSGLRVTGGRLGRRHFAVPKSGVRPTSDRARESIFSALGAHLDDAIVLDLFAGSGALGIEALSRGAARGFFVEQDGAVLRVLRANLESLELLSAAEVVRDDAFRALALFAAKGLRFDVVFVDPPYALALPNDVALRIAAVLAPDGVLVLERAARDDERDFQDWRTDFERTYGEARVRFLRAPRAPAPANDDATAGDRP